MKHAILVLMGSILIHASAYAGSFASDFAVVMIDDATEAKLGPFPYDRKVYAEAIDSCARHKAKAVVLKFFLDEAKSGSGDAALGDSMRRIPVALQARLASTQGTSQRIPAKFSLGMQKLKTSTSGDQGWIPLPDFMAAAAAIGFVDFNSSTIPLVEEYQGIPFKSLVLCCLEMAAGNPARMADGKIHVGHNYLPLDDSHVYTADLKDPESLKTISFAQLLAGEVKKEEIEGRVVIIGWDSKRTPTLDTENGPIKIHRFFARCVAASYEALLASGQVKPRHSPR